MLFADVALAHRIERAEAGMLRDATELVGHRLPVAQVLCEELAGGLATFTEPGSPLNKVIGLGFAGPLDPGERAFAERSEPMRIELASLADPSFAEALTRRGYALLGFENVLGVALPHRVVGSAAAELELAESPRDELEAWLDVLVAGFAAPDLEGVGPAEVHETEMLRRIIRDFARTPGVVRFLARRAGEPVGGASMRVAEGVALLSGAATLAAHRRRGVQTAMLAERLARASAAGCELAVITTQPGSKSMQNAQRHGFELLYVRAILHRELER